ncbi:MAG: LuxR C-terminal-related transcriptional regulator [Tranquillimonas sp.]
MTLTAEAHRRLLSRMFAAAVEPSCWNGVLEELAVVLDGAKTHMFGYDSSRGLDLGFLHSRHDPEWFADYGTTYGHLNPYPKLGETFPVRRAIDLRALLPEAGLVKTSYYNRFLRPQENLSNGAGMMLDRRPRAMLVFGSLHPERFRDRLDDLAPSVLNTLSRDLAAAWQMTRVTATAAFDAGLVAPLPAPGGVVAALDAQGRIAFLNPAAQAALAEGRWLREIPGNRLGLRDSGAQEVLLHMLAQLGAGPHPTSRTLILGSGRTRAQCHLAPCYPDDLSDRDAGFVLGLLRPVVMVTIRPLPTVQPDTGPLLASGLTAAEIDVALALARGLDAQAIADQRGVSLHTVRNQIKAAMTKCGVSRQTQLVALLAQP